MNELFSKIADSELQILRLLWENKKAMTMPEIRDALRPITGWDGSTIKTLLYRLCDKGAVHAEKRNIFYYTPLIVEKEYNDYVTNTFIDKMFRGSAKNLVASLVDSKRLKNEDIAELQAMFKVGE